MINIISKIFKERNHEEIESSDFKIFSLKEKHNYWVVISRNNLTKIKEEQTILFLKAKEVINQPQFDKNANLLVLYNISNTEDANKDAILQTEEDPFHFKKSVIYYTTEELNKLSELIGTSNITSAIETLILKEDVFTKHKSAFDANEYQSLLYRIVHKIPFIQINIAQVNNLQSLEEINKNAIGQNSLNDILEKELFVLTSDELAVITNENLLEKLKTILPDEN
jgi:hypothetical protein